MNFTPQEQVARWVRVMLTRQPQRGYPRILEMRAKHVRNLGLSKWKQSMRVWLHADGRLTEVGNETHVIFSLKSEETHAV